jgi:hypothetical protein
VGAILLSLGGAYFEVPTEIKGRAAPQRRKKPIPRRELKPSWPLTFPSNLLPREYSRRCGGRFVSSRLPTPGGRRSTWFGHSCNNVPDCARTATTSSCITIRQTCSRRLAQVSGPLPCLAKTARHGAPHFSWGTPFLMRLFLGVTSAVPKWESDAGNGGILVLGKSLSSPPKWVFSSYVVDSGGKIKLANMSHLPYSA